MAVTYTVLSRLDGVYGKQRSELIYEYRFGIVEVVKIKRRQFGPDRYNTHSVHNILIGCVSLGYNALIPAKLHPWIKRPDALDKSIYYSATPRQNTRRAFGIIYVSVFLLLVYRDHRACYSVRRFVFRRRERQSYQLCLLVYIRIADLYNSGGV